MASPFVGRRSFEPSIAIEVKCLLTFVFCSRKIYGQKLFFLPSIVQTLYDGCIMSKMRLGELLMQENKIDETQLLSALGYQRRWGRKLGECLIQLGFIQEIELCQTLSKALRVPLIDLAKIDNSRITKDVLNLVSLQTARSQRIIPLAIKDIKGKKRLVLATSDPTNFKALDEIQFRSNLPVLTMVCPDSDIEWFIRKHYLGEMDTLPLNYISGISPMVDPDGKFEIDPVSSIFFDAEFTGMTNIGKTGAKTNPGTNRTSSKKNKT